MRSIPAVLVFFSSATFTALQERILKIELNKTEDSAEIVSIHDTTFVTVTSESGIGEARMTRVRNEWPARITIRLKLGGLESLGMDNGLIHFGTSLYRPKQTAYWRTGKSASDGTLDVRITRTNDAIEILVPGEMMEGNPESIRFAWIDFFRN
jgi:hypothetical protein